MARMSMFINTDADMPVEAEREGDGASQRIVLSFGVPLTQPRLVFTVAEAQDAIVALMGAMTDDEFFTTYNVIRGYAWDRDDERNGIAELLRDEQEAAE